MNVQSAAIPDVKIITPQRFGDARGYVCEAFSEKAWEAACLPSHYVQDNQSYSKAAYTLRGMHYQLPPFAQAKLVRVVRGAVLDFAVDIRKGSPTYGRYVAVELRAELGNQILIPEGFAHGILTLKPDTELLYKMTRPYSPQRDRGFLWRDPVLALQLPVAEDQITLSEKDKNLPLLKDAENPFTYGS